MLFAPNQMCDSPPFSLRTEEASRMKLKDVPSLSFQAPWTPVSERCSRTWETWDQETFLHLLLSSVVNLCELQHQVPVLSWQEWPPAWSLLLLTSCCINPTDGRAGKSQPINSFRNTPVSHFCHLLLSDAQFEDPAASCWLSSALFW